MKKTPSGTVLEAADSDTDARPDLDTTVTETDRVDASGNTDEAEDNDNGAPEIVGTQENNPGNSQRQRWVVRVVAAVLAVLTITATVLAVTFGWKLKDRNDIDTASRQASAAAQSYAVTLTSIDSQHIDQNFADVMNGATGDFKNMYSQSSAQLKTLLVQNKAVSKGQVLAVGIKSATKDRVEVTLFVDQTITNSVSPDARVDRSRIVITMDRVGGRWLAEKVEMI